MKYYKLIITSLVIVLIFISGLLFYLIISEQVTTRMDKYDNHEDLSKVRYENWQIKLDEYVFANDQDSMKLFSARLDAQLKLEDFLIKSRQAEHASFILYGSVIVAIASLIITIITLLMNQHYRKSSHNFLKD